MDAIHYLRTEEHYRNAPPGTVVYGPFLDDVTKVGPGMWNYNGLYFTDAEVVGRRRRIRHYPASGA